MEAEKMKKLIECATEIGYEITEIKPKYIDITEEPKSIWCGAYKVCIVPLKSTEPKI